MATRKHQDKYANIARQDVLQSAANAETFEELQTGISLGQGTGMLIDQIDYYIPPATMELLLLASDQLICGWTTSDAAGALGNDRRTSLHVTQIALGPVIGAAASAGTPFVTPLAFQFFPALIIAAPRLFLGMDSESIAAAGRCSSRIYFRYIDLSAQEYLELAETFVLVA